MHTITTLIAMLLFLLPVAASAQDQHEALVQEVFRKSGMEQQLGQLPLIIQAGFDQAASRDPNVNKLPKELVTTMRGLIEEAFTPQGLKEGVLTQLREKLSNQDLKDALQWFDSPLGKNCTQLEEAATTPAALVQIQRYGARLRNSPPTGARLNVLRQFDAAIKATANSVDLAVDTQVAVALAINATLPLEQQLPLDKITGDLKKIRPQIEAALKSEILLSLLYTYRSLTEAQLRQYIAFARSPVGLKYNTVTIAALRKAFMDAGIRWGRAIGESMRQMPKQTEA